LALDFRQAFERDIVIDLVGFRRWGHNETDEPSFTQPRLYSAIEKQGRLKDRFVAEMVARGDVSADEAKRLEEESLQYLREQFDQSTESSSGGCPGPPTPVKAERDHFGGPEPEDRTVTAVAEAELRELLQKLAQAPQDFHLHPKLKKSQDDRRKMAAGEEPLDWSTAEALAIATLAVEGHRVRFAGQDTQRGTFSQRHAILHDVIDGRTLNIFAELDPARQAPVEIINSPLNEAAAMGFEYGYSLESPRALVAWEAQFGDFVNAAQVIVDQFLASAEDKWEQLNGIVLLLPHGFEGQGPEHSSARLERFLMLASEDNLQIVTPSTPAQYFHVLRRQVKRRWSKPLVIFTPKSLLRHKQARSPLSELARGRFERVLTDESVRKPSRILLASGKVYYELAAFRAEHQRDDVALVRIEQYYPLPDRMLSAALKQYPAETPAYWVQEEPENMGAARHWKARFGSRLLDRFPLSFVARVDSASPATGSKAIHRQEQHDVLERAFGQPAAPPTPVITSREKVS
jgi:2-oxoglutarate dehydrogenase E1 component